MVKVCRVILHGRGKQKKRKEMNRAALMGNLIRMPVTLSIDAAVCQYLCKEVY
jgi:hypothetical protein